MKKNRLSKCAAILAPILSFFLTLLFTTNLKAQTPYSASIIDASVQWTHSGSSYSGMLMVYMTDTVMISGVSAQIGSHADSSDLGTASGTLSASSATLTGNNLSLSLGSFSYHSDYFIVVKVLYSDSSSKIIFVHSSN